MDPVRCAPSHRMEAWSLVLQVLDPVDLCRLASVSQAHAIAASAMLSRDLLDFSRGQEPFPCPIIVSTGREGGAAEKLPHGVLGFRYIPRCVPVLVSVGDGCHCMADKG